MHEIQDTQIKELALGRFIKDVSEKTIVRLLPLVDRGHAEEIFQEAVLKIFLLAEQNPHNICFEEKLSMLTPMLFSIAKNMAISQIRHTRIEENYVQNKLEHDALANTVTLEASIINNDQSHMLLDAINHLPPICRQVFVQRKLNGRSHAQIASMLNISNKTVENHIARGIKLCREYIRRHYKEAARKVG